MTADTSFVTFDTAIGVCGVAWTPRGIREAYEALARRLDSPHEAQHQVMECLGEMLWQAQRSGLPPDGDQYVDSVRRRAMR